MSRKLSITLRATLVVLGASGIVLLTAVAPAAAKGSSIDPHGQPAVLDQAGAIGPASPLGEDGPTTPQIGSSIDPNG